MGKYNKFSMIDMEDLSDLELLKTHIMYCDEYEELPKERQAEIYQYCRIHATNEVCIKNLAVIRHAVTRIYFDS